MEDGQIEIWRMDNSYRKRSRNDEHARCQQRDATFFQPRQWDHVCTPQPPYERPREQGGAQPSRSWAKLDKTRERAHAATTIPPYVCAHMTSHHHHHSRVTMAIIIQDAEHEAERHLRGRTVHTPAGGRECGQRKMLCPSQRREMHKPIR